MTSRYTYESNRSIPNVSYNGVDYKNSPEYRIRSVTNTDIDKVKDLLLDELLNKIKGLANATLNYIIGILATAIYVVSIFKILTVVTDMEKSIPPVIQQNAIWKMMDRIPLVVWFIVVSIVATLTDLLDVPMMRVVCMAVSGALMLLYAVRTWGTCSRPLLLAAGIYTLAVCALQMKLIGVTTVQDATALFYFINWGSIIVYLLGIVDYYTNGCKYPGK